MGAAIVVGTDGSAGAARAVTAAAYLARVTRAPLVVLAVDPPGSAVADAEAAAREAGAPHVAAVVGAGDPADALVRAAEEHRAGMVVVGARGAGRERPFPLGSVANAVTHAAPCDVLVVHPRDGARRAGRP